METAGCCTCSHIHKPAQSAVYRDPFTTHHSRSRLAEIAASRTGELVEPPTTTTSVSAEAVNPCTRRPFDWLSRQFCFAGRLYCEAETSHWQYPSPTYRYTRRPSLLFPPAAIRMANAACIHLRHTPSSGCGTHPLATALRKTPGCCWME